MVKDLILKNWWLKLMALLLAAILWRIVQGNQGERILTIPIAVQIPQDMVICNERPASVEVTIEGITALGGRLPDVTCIIDLRSAGEGTHTVSMIDQIRVTPASYGRVLSVFPDQATIALEWMVAKDVPVRVPIQGKLASGLELYEISPRPAVVHIRGGKSSVESLREAATEPVQLTGRSQSFQTNLSFRFSRDDIQASPASVQADILLGGHRDEQTISVPLDVSGNIEANPSQIAITALVPVSLKRRIVPGDFRATAGWDGGQETANLITVTPAIKAMNPEITVVRFNPPKVVLLRKGKK
jgi:YbbR domain-containing protein